MKLLSFCVVAVAASMMWTPVWSAGLTGAQVKGFVHVMQELKPLFDKYADEIGDDGDAMSTAHIVRDWAGGLQGQTEAEGVLRRYSFDSTSWSAVSQQVTEAYMALKFGKDGQDISAQLQDALRAIEDSSDFPAEDKEQMVARMKQSIEEFERIRNVPQADQDAVQPYLTNLDTIFDWQE
ncbi:MAG: hypothetical protein GXY42_13600 [Desulfovibrionales bacterium]|nr:hypothetical protein [Desulfovibrionales bacterium]